MDIIISTSSGRPIYEQITDQIKSAIVTGQLAEGEQLPSIRALANSLRVSAITTKRAYADLEAAGLIETVQGKGTYVAGGNAELIREEQMREVEGLLAKAVERGRTIGLTDDEISLVCETNAAPRDAVQRDDGWRAFRISGTLDLSLVGVLRGIADVLADIGVPVFVVSTYDTDYVLVRERFLDRALDELSAAGYTVVRD